MRRLVWEPAPGYALRRFPNKAEKADNSCATEPDNSKNPRQYAELGKQLRNNQFQRALYLDSMESSHDLKGEIYAVIDYPFTAVNVALNNPAHWCDVLILHISSVRLTYKYPSQD